MVNELSQSLRGRTLRHVLDRFSRLSAGDLEQLSGDWKAEFVGPRWLIAAAPLSLSLVGFRGWWGKRLFAEKSANLFDGGTRTGYSMRLEVASSVFDGRPCWASASEAMASRV